MEPENPDYDVARYGDAGAQVLAKLVKHVVCLSWIDVRTEPLGLGNQESDYDPAAFAISGFVITVRSIWFFITAGHILQDLKSRLRVGRRIMKSRLFADLASKKTSQAVPFTLGDTPQWYINSEGVDYAVIPLRPGFVRPLIADGILPLTETSWNDCPDKADDYFLLGFPSQAKTVSIASNGIKGTVNISVGCPLLPIFPVSDPPSTLKCSNARFYAKVPIVGGIVQGIQTKLTDIDGMSGGPIFAIKWIDSKNIRYWVIAVQSGWLRSERTLAACPILPLVNAIEQSIDDHLGSVDEYDVTQS